MLGTDDKERQFLKYLHSEECHELFKKIRLLFILKLEIYFLITLIVMKVSMISL